MGPGGGDVLKHILIVATGGTIASTPQGGGLAPGLSGRQVADYVPQASEVARVDVVQPLNIDSTNMSPADWLLIASTIAGAYEDYDGFVVLHGTDTMAYTIAELSYIEAMELCNFGAKVVYPPTIYPVCVKNIPIKVKNTFNPTNPGTTIKAEIANDHKPIKGISSINGTALITVTGLSMVGVIGVNVSSPPWHKPASACSWWRRHRRRTPPASVCATKMPTRQRRCSTKPLPPKSKTVPCSPCTSSAVWPPWPSWEPT